MVTACAPLCCTIAGDRRDARARRDREAARQHGSSPPPGLVIVSEASGPSRRGHPPHRGGGSHVLASCAGSRNHADDDRHP